MNLRDLIEVKKILLNEVPCLLIRPKTIQGKIATLFHYHGWGSKKESHEFLATIVAQYGYQVILPDSKYHGERTPLEEYHSKNMMKYFWEIINLSVREFYKIQKQSISLYNVDKDAIAVSGSSMGGYIASSIFAQNINVKTLINFNGGSSWQETERFLQRKLDITKQDIERMISREEARAFDPLTYKETFYPRPILLMHGDADTSVPIEIQRHFYKEVLPLYNKQKGKIKLEEYHNMNHHISIKMAESAIEWLNIHLERGC